MKKIFLLLVIIGLTTTLKAQKKPTIQFDKKIHDYGKINEADGKASCVFTFTNIGDDTLLIKGVRPGCGCTASKYTKEPVLPGKTGTIEAVYNPTNRPGNFNKSITVTTNDPDNASIVINIKGSVIAKPKTKADNYPNKLGSLRFKTNHLSLGEIVNNKIVTDTFEIYNDSKKEISLSIKEIPAFITADIKDNIIKPEMESSIIIKYDAKAKADYGYVFDKIFITTNDDDQAEKLLYVSANIIQDFSTLTEKQKAKAPHILFEKETYKFEKVKAGETVEFSFMFQNTGKSNLKILKTKASCGCTTPKLSKTEFKKGEKGEIKVSFNTSGRTGNQHKTINVISNDPEKSVIVLHIEGEIE